ncbi:hypothetical protein [Leptolyngbya sp. FACHB-261]|uniref:hypothetical protein n=1 Tax=Leptolyngbya sp. FACHB-261 TaxID=2692806 RepID=UPI001683D482|nr:hypothetical protein [Leptolyngbya sp. FACHB-261]MBD2102726.1 hypothetical protein [Leptolyngbya sp. FACHB-261]
MYCIIETPEDRKVYLCERDSEGLLRIWDSEGKEISINHAPSPLAVASELMRRHQVVTAVRRRYYEQQQYRERLETPPGVAVGMFKLVVVGLVALAVAWQAQVQMNAVTPERQVTDSAATQLHKSPDSPARKY